VSKGKAGRPTKYLPSYAEQAEKYAVVGLPLKDMAYIWGVEPDTVTNWQKRYPDFSEALKRGEARKKASLLTALYRNAVTKDNVAAQIFLSKNWLGMKDKQDLGIGPASDSDGDSAITIEVVHTRNGKGNGKGNGDGNE
jgi:hypothetical protein